MMYESIIITLLAVYVLRMLYFAIGARKENRKKLNEIAAGSEPMVTIVVPARNEEARIEDCIRSIARNQYPRKKFEIIAVNDRSEDETGQLLESLKREIPNLSVIHNDKSKAIKNLQGKPGALQLAINSCRGTIILMTDADCTVSETWIRSHAATFRNSNLGITAAYTNIIGSNPFSRIQAVEWLYLHTMAIGGMGHGQPLSCYGNNISLHKEKFDTIGGYSALKFSITEDLAMLQAMHKHGYDTRHLSDEASMINTYANKTLREYLNQHHRWIVGAADLKWKAAYFVLSTLAIWSALVISIANQDYLMAGIATLTRILCDLSLILPAMYRLKRGELAKWLLPAIIFMMVIELIAPVFLLKRDVRWKGQVFTDEEAN